MPRWFLPAPAPTMAASVSLRRRTDLSWSSRSVMEMEAGSRYGASRYASGKTGLSLAFFVVSNFARKAFGEFYSALFANHFAIARKFFQNAHSLRKCWLQCLLLRLAQKEINFETILGVFDAHNLTKPAMGFLTNAVSRTQIK